MTRRDEGLLELHVVTDIYSDGYEVEILGDNCRVTHWTWMKPPGERVMRKVVVAKLIRPRSSMKTQTQMGMLMTAPAARLAN